MTKASFLTLSRSPTEAELDWETLYTTQLPRVYNFFRYRVGDHQTAEDLTATTFEKAWRARARYRRDEAGFTTWLFTIARNTATDHLRRQRPIVSLECCTQQAEESSSDTTLDRAQRWERLQRLITALPERERDLIALKYGSELTNRAIATLMGLSESHVGTLLHRTIQKLHNEWTDA